MIQLGQLFELAKLSMHKSRNLLSDVKYYCNKISNVFYAHIVFISNSIFWSGLCLLRLENHLRSQVAQEVANKLTLSCQRPLSYRNQSIDLPSKSINWNLYDNGLRHESVKRLQKSSEEKSYLFMNDTKLFCIYCINEDVR